MWAHEYWGMIQSMEVFNKYCSKKDYFSEHMAVIHLSEGRFLYVWAKSKYTEHIFLNFTSALGSIDKTAIFSLFRKYLQLGKVGSERRGGGNGGGRQRRRLMKIKPIGRGFLINSFLRDLENEREGSGEGYSSKSVLRNICWLLFQEGLRWHC